MTVSKVRQQFSLFPFVGPYGSIDQWAYGATVGLYYAAADLDQPPIEVRHGLGRGIGGADFPSGHGAVGAVTRSVTLRMPQNL